MWFYRPTFERVEHETPEGGKAMRLERVEKLALAPCPCETTRRQKLEEEQVAREKQRWIEQCIRNGNIPPKYKDARFETWEHRPETEAAYQAAFKCAQAVAAGEREAGLILMGGVGNGKNQLAACICRYAAEHGRTFIYQDVAGLLKMIQATFNGGESTVREATILRALMECDLLVLNDWGAENWTPWTETELHHIIDNAYVNYRNVVITTNAMKMKREPGDPPNIMVFRELMSERTYDRLLEMCTWVVNEGPSYRREKARSRNA